MDKTFMSSEAQGNRECEVAAAKLSRAELAEATRRDLVIVDPNGCLKAKEFHWEVPDEVAYLGLREFNGTGSMPKRLAARWLIC
jgi:hypothetical protein